MNPNWKLVWSNLREFSAGRSLETDYRWIKAEIFRSAKESA